jgi:hypothetical protein
VKIEHVNGILKEKFGSLKELRIRISDVKGHTVATNWITACIIVYNALLPFEEENTRKPSSQPECHFDLESSESDDSDSDESPPLRLNSAERKRINLYNHVIHKIGK